MRAPATGRTSGVSTDAAVQASPNLLTGHEHGWIVESAHSTSLGRVLYVRCAECGVRRIDVQQYPDAPPTLLSMELRQPPGGATP